MFRMTAIALAAVATVGIASLGLNDIPAVHPGKSKAAAHSYLSVVDGQPARHAGHAGPRRYGEAHADRNGPDRRRRNLAVITSDGRYVYATFDAGASGTGGVAVVDVRRRKVVDFALQSI